MLIFMIIILNKITFKKISLMTLKLLKNIDSKTSNNRFWHQENILRKKLFFYHQEVDRDHQVTEKD